jgi:two-component system, OmpR family, phosphate regulon sensor histidine kinase PhoR
MPYSPGIKALAALGIAAAGALAGLLLNGDVQASLVMLVCGVAAVLVATAGGDPAGPLDTAPAAAEGPGIAEVLDAIAEPVLLIADRRVIAANPPARTLLGQHILGEDVRVAIRHPAAAERLMNPNDHDSSAPIHLVGLGTRDQRWEMRVTALGDGRHIVHLIDRTGSYASERIRVDFVANASHELRTPLASLLGYVETLEDGASEDPGIRKRFLKIMHDEARRMQRLIDDLISLSRIEAEKYRAADNPVAMDELIDEVCLELSGVPRAADVVTEIAETQPVRGDASQLSQLLHNVIGNAMKYGREGTPILVSLMPEGDSMVRLTVTDQGEGIAPEHLPRLTERFYRVDSGRSRTLGGTGLGLAIVKHIVERHRGRFDIASTVGKGSTVTVLLPVHRLS